MRYWTRDDLHGHGLTEVEGGSTKSGMEEYDVFKTSRVMSRDEVRAVDRWAIEEIGVPGVVLMENAGRSCAELIREKLAGTAGPVVCIFCGAGNNGGDGYVIARHLRNAGFDVRIAVCARREKIAGDALVNLQVLERLGQPVEWIDPAGPDAIRRIQELASGTHAIVDALFGTGLQGELRPEYRAIVDAINGMGIPILAVDIPSGLDCDTGQPLGTAILATWTATFVAVKKGFVANPQSKRYTGSVCVASIGVEPS
jgi:hydroxyethylthiazole kinase-like uncharacterized protein yjeF